MPKYNFRRKQPTDEKELEGMLVKTDKLWLKSLTAFLYLYGCRISEARAVRRRDLVEDGEYLVARISILKRKQKTSGPYETNFHYLRVSLNAPFVKSIILPYLEGKSSDSLLWTKSRWYCWRCLKDLNHNISPHIFRHDRLTKIAMMGGDAFTLQDWAGWTDIRPATNYVHAAGNLAAKFSDRIT